MASRLLAVGGQHKEWESETTASRGWHRSRGVYLMGATRLTHILNGSWFPRWRQEDGLPRTRILDGHHPGCVERRREFGSACEFDGKLSVARYAGRYLLFARANLNAEGGGRFVQVAASNRAAM